MRARRVVYLGAALLASIGVLAAVLVVRQHRDAAVERRMLDIQHAAGEREIDCAQVRASQPIVLLALGQSNAANHGAARAPALDPVVIAADGRCVLTSDPLPGGTGYGASIWRRVPDSLARLGVARPVVFSVLAVVGVGIEEWTRRNSPLRKRLESQVAGLRKLGFTPDLVLWQHGEFDSMAGTSMHAYREALDQLGAQLAEAGAGAPLLLAQSTTCHGVQGSAIRAAIETAAAASTRFRRGPDTDTLQDARYRYDDCHFSADGLMAAARMWADSIKTHLPPQHL